MESIILFNRDKSFFLKGILPIASSIRFQNCLLSPVWRKSLSTDWTSVRIPVANYKCNECIKYSKNYEKCNSYFFCCQNIFSKLLKKIKKYFIYWKWFKKLILTKSWRLARSMPTDRRGRNPESNKTLAKLLGSLCCGLYCWLLPCDGARWRAYELT